MPLIPLADYERIFRVIYSVSEAAGAATAHACLLFGVAGAAILTGAYKKKALPVAGSAFFRVHDPSRTIISLSQLHAGEPVCSPEAFHCWVMCDGYAIDFMAPIFNEALRSTGATITVPRRMFQKQLTKMAPAFSSLEREGDFYLKPDYEVTKQLLQGFIGRPMNTDLVNICANWYARPPRPMRQRIGMADNDGRVHNVPLRPMRITEAW